MVRNQKKAQKKESFRTRFFAALYILPLMLLAVLVLQRCQKNMERAGRTKKQTKKLAAKYQSEVERNDPLQKDSAIVDTKEYVVRVAEKKLGLMDCGEVIFKVKHWGRQ